MLFRKYVHTRVRLPAGTRGFLICTIENKLWYLFRFLFGAYILLEEGGRSVKVNTHFHLERLERFSLSPRAPSSYDAQNPVYYSLPLEWSGWILFRVSRCKGLNLQPWCLRPVLFVSIAICRSYGLHDPSLDSPSEQKVSSPKRLYRLWNPPILLFSGYLGFLPTRVQRR